RHRCRPGGGDGGRAPRLLARRHRRYGQRRRLRRGHGGRAHPEGARRPSPAHHPLRVVDGRGAGPARLARIRRGALRGALRRRGPPRLPGAPPAGEPRRPRGPLTLKPAHAKLSAYFNIDNGTGAVRGIYTQQNAAAVPLFESWLSPFADLGATTVTNRDTRGTDHLSFDEVGLPGFQFVQDKADYDTRTHHTNLDVYDRLQRDDLMQASVVLASFLYDAATLAEAFPPSPSPPR